MLCVVNPRQLTTYFERGYQTVSQSLLVGVSHLSYQRWEGHFLQGTVRNNTSKYCKLCVCVRTSILPHMSTQYVCIHCMYVVDTALQMTLTNLRNKGAQYHYHMDTHSIIHTTQICLPACRHSSSH